MSCFSLQGKTAHLVFIVSYTCQVENDFIRVNNKDVHPTLAD